MMSKISKQFGTIHKGLKGFIPVSIAYSLCFFAIRIFEIVAVSSKHVLPENWLVTYFYGTLLDITVISLILLPSTLLFLLIARLNHKTAVYVVSTLLFLHLSIYAALIFYFTELLIPLGSDLFAYDFIEIYDTIFTSVDLGFIYVIPFLLFLILFSVLIRFFSNKAFPEKVFNAALISLLLLSLIFLTLYPRQNNFKNESNYFLAVNKLVFFQSQWIDYILHDAIEPYFGEEFPFYSNVDAEDALSEFLLKSEKNPNFVFVIVEGLGGSFMKPHGPYTGFTPFLDSLINEGLYWSNFVSTSGRSFAVQPSLFGSLPFGERGFMEMGFRAPNHETFISLLNDHGYHTAYFCGYESHFDQLDVFLERQDIDLVMDASRFDVRFQKMDEIDGGFTWGYSDKDVYKRAFEFLDEIPSEVPRLDMYFTLNFHEPFITPDKEKYAEMYNEIVSNKEFEPVVREIITNYEGIFTALLYTDDSIRELIQKYMSRDDYHRTIFIITGDHRIAPIPHRSRIDRYHVPFIIYSPLIKQQQQFNSVSSHLNVTPSLVAHLKNTYGFDVPDENHWITGGLDTNINFRSIHELPFMRNKNQMLDYLSGEYYLSDDILYKLEDGMLLRRLDDNVKLDEVRKRYENFRSVNRYVTSKDKLMPVEEGSRIEFDLIAEEDAFIRRNRLRRANTEELFEKAREYAFNSSYESARIILRRVLRIRPNYHEVRVFKGRIYGWEGEYDKAENLLLNVLDRNEEYPEAYKVLIDLYFWMGDNEKSLEVAETGLMYAKNDPDMLYRVARSYYLTGDQTKALEFAEDITRNYPEHEEGLELYNLLRSPGN